LKQDLGDLGKTHEFGMKKKTVKSIELGNK